MFCGHSNDLLPSLSVIMWGLWNLAGHVACKYERTVFQLEDSTGRDHVGESGCRLDDGIEMRVRIEFRVLRIEAQDRPFVNRQWTFVFHKSVLYLLGPKCQLCGTVISPGVSESVTCREDCFAVCH